MNHNELYASLDPKDGVGTVLKLLKHFSPLFAGTVGLDGRPEVRPVSFAYEKDGALYFLTMKSRRMYAELSKTPSVSICAGGGGTVFRLSGKVCFSEDAEVIETAVRERPDMLEAAGGEKKMLIAFFLLNAEAEVGSALGEIPEMSIRLPDPDGVLIGITIKKKTELRDRLVRVFGRREAEPPVTDPETLRLFDGALFVFADAAKALWPRMDVQPVERAAVFETWDEREKYVSLAASLIGNAVIASPEDITYWLNPETLNELREKKKL